MKIVDVMQMTDNRCLNMFEIRYQDMRGNEKRWHMVSRQRTPRCVTFEFDNPDAVVIIPFHEPSGKLVLIKEFRVPLGDYQYGFPAGLVDPGETVFGAAKRELEEETGLTATRLLFQRPPAYTSTGISDESVSMVNVACNGEPSQIHNESSEDIETILVSYAQVFVAHVRVVLQVVPGTMVADRSVVDDIAAVG
ncbi:MAG: NUDIX hydrolase [Pseudomonadota bacterium]